MSKPVVIHGGLCSFWSAEMSQHPSSDDLARVVNALTQYEQPTITGAVLGTLVRRVAPDLNLRAAVDLPVGTGALARFVDRFLAPCLRKAGQTATDGTGGDIVYEVLRNSSSNDLTQGPLPTAGAQDYWLAFVRPSDTRGLVVVRHDGQPRIRFADDPDAAGGNAIANVSQEEFKQITEDFLSMLESGPATQQLAASLRGASSYSAFVQNLKDAGTAYFVRWSTHRREYLRRLFLERVEGAGFNLADQQILLAELDKSQEVARQEIKQRGLERTAEFAMPQPPQHSLVQASESPEQFARDLLKATADRMSLDEIRGITITFGHLIDALQFRAAKR